ncbi:MAG TPA: hypothetical protein VGL56_05405 [Fimbriimonadaceae bacterium]|jgi:hypothetical protein
MKLRHLTIFIAALLVVGCKPADSTSTTTSTTAPSATTTDSTAAKAPDAGTTSSTTADNSANSIVGTWTVDDPDVTNGVCEFKDDGTTTMSGEIKDPKGVEMTAMATYKLDGTKLTITPKDMKMTATADADDKSKKFVEAQEKAMTPDAISKMPAEEDTITWTDKDTFTTTNDKDKSKKPTTFKRKAA